MFFTSNRSFYPSTRSTTSVRPDSWLDGIFCDAEHSNVHRQHAPVVQSSGSRGAHGGSGAPWSPSRWNLLSCLPTYSIFPWREFTLTSTFCTPCVRTSHLQHHQQYTTLNAFFLPSTISFGSEALVNAITQQQ